MSQVNEDNPQATSAVEDDEALFAEGFNLGDDDGESTEDRQGNDQQQTDDSSEKAPAENQDQQSDADNTAAKEEVQHEQPAQPAPPMPAQQPYQQIERPQASEPAKPEPPKLIEVPEHLADELATLKKLNPAAAELALEDSAEGERLRSRMEEFGAEMALDRAEMVLDKRNRETAAHQAEVARQQQTIAEHNNRFMATLQREHPEYAAMITDPARREEAVKKQNEIMGWISAKPYAEGARLMKIAQEARDPNEVCALITQFESERQAKPKQADPTGALAVPGRGAPTAPAGIGDKDDFDAGWNANPSK